MKPLEKSFIPESEVDMVIRDLRRAWDENRCAKFNYGQPMPQEMYDSMIKHVIMEAACSDVYINDVYQVYKYVEGPVIHLSIKRRDRKEIRDWRDVQDIKNQMLGEEVEAVELYPAESRRLDVANQYHIYSFGPGHRFPFGFTDARAVSDDLTLGKSQQRPLEKLLR